LAAVKNNLLLTAWGFYVAWTLITDFAAAHRLPIGGAGHFAADRGAVFSYAGNLTEQGRLSAALADKILKGSPAGTIPVVTSETYLRLNYKKARELGLTVPEELFSLAANIIR
jgi:putative ABC transport system substrate-binding protein